MSVLSDSASVLAMLTYPLKYMFFVYCIVLYCIGKLIYQSPEVMLHKYTFVGPIQALSETRRMTIFDIEPLGISQIPYRPVWKDRLRDNQAHQVSYLPVFCYF